MNKIQYVEFIDWVRDKKGKPIIQYNKKEKNRYYLERWIIEVEGLRKEHIKRELIKDDNENLNPNDAPIKQWMVPNSVTDTMEEVEAHSIFGRKVLGRAGMRIVKNQKLKELKAKDIKRKTAILEMIRNPAYLLYKPYLRIKYKCMNSPNLTIMKKWNAIPKNIRFTINNAIIEYEAKDS